jgi:hypothetical protein
VTGPVVVLIVVLIAVPVFLLLLKFDAWMTEREYQRRIGGDEVRRYAEAREAIAKAQTTHPAYKHRRPRKGAPND